jgi:endonuclease-3
MATTTNKQKVLNQLFSSIKVDVDSRAAEPLPVLEQFIYGLCREGASREMADHAYQALREQFFDWNEVRVSASRELEEVFEDMPFPEKRAQRVISFLQEVFESTFSFDLDALQKKGVKEAAKKLSRFEAATPFVVSWVLQQSVDAHAIPLDSAMLQAVQRLGLVDEQTSDLESIQGALEHLVPKSKGPQFAESLSDLTQEHCYEDSPNCKGCPLRSECPTGQTLAPQQTMPVRSARVKPR